MYNDEGLAATTPGDENPSLKTAYDEFTASGGPLPYYFSCSED